MDHENIDRRALLRGAWRQKKVPGPVRSPGAVDEKLFHDLCNGCGDCAAICPADAIVMTAPATKTGSSSPEIHANEAPCVMCDGLVCASTCPTDALIPIIPTVMKIAVLDFEPASCWATSGIDPSCDLCFDRCPQKNLAITYTHGQGPSFHYEHCTGCGVCVFYCPSNLKPLSLTAPIR